jgi:hypothetical protein
VCVCVCERERERERARERERLKKNQNSRVWWCMPAIPALRRLRQEDCEFQA